MLIILSAVYGFLLSKIDRQHSHAVGSTVDSQQESHVFEYSGYLEVCGPSLHDPSLLAGFRSRYCSFLPQSKELHVSLVSESKLALNM